MGLTNECSLNTFFLVEVFEVDFFFLFFFFEKNGSPLKFQQFKVTRVISLSNVILPKRYSLDKYFKIFTVRLHVLYVFNINVKFCTN